MQRSCTGQHASRVRPRSCLWARECLRAYRNRHTLQHRCICATPTALKTGNDVLLLFSIPFSSYSVRSLCTQQPKTHSFFLFLWRLNTSTSGSKEAGEMNLLFSPKASFPRYTSYGHIENKLCPYWRLDACDGGKECQTDYQVSICLRISLLMTSTWFVFLNDSEAPDQSPVQWKPINQQR